jgi:hypothetical protein
MSEIEQLIGNQDFDPVVKTKEIELNTSLFARILSAGFDKPVGNTSIKSMKSHGILHPLVCPRNGTSSYTPKDLLTAYIAVSIKRSSGFPHWIDVARTMPAEGTFKNGEYVRGGDAWLRIAWMAKRLAGIDFDNYTELAPILERR